MVQTVLGEIEPEKMGNTLVHEHVFVDGSCWFEEPKDKIAKGLAHSKVTIDKLNDVKRWYRYSIDNWVLDDPKIAEKELRYFKEAGGGTIFDVTCNVPGRDPIGLTRIARKVGINIVAGTGFYIQAAHPLYVAKSSAEKLAEMLETELNVGIAGTKVRAGIIGEIGISSNKMKPDEKKVLRAASRAHLKNTKVPITVHTFEPFDPEIRQGLDVLDVFESEGVKLEKVYLSHMDALRNRKGPFGADVEYFVKVAERGAYVSFDGFGCWEWPAGSNCYNLIYPTDFERALAIKDLIDRGFLERIVLSHDVGMKLGLKSYGGTGYDHLLTSVMRIFERYGIGERETRYMFIENPRRLVS
jgi:phosphotriesterase-related protein